MIFFINIFYWWVEKRKRKEWDVKTKKYIYIKFDKAGYINLSEKFKFSLHDGKLVFILYVAWY